MDNNSQNNKLLTNNAELFSDNSSIVFSNNQQINNIQQVNNNRQINNIQQENNNQQINSIQQVNNNQQINNIQQVNDYKVNNTQPANNYYNYNRINEIKDKINNNKPVEYADDYMDDYGADKEKFISILTNKSFLSIVTILILVCVCILVGKTTYFRKKVDTYEEFFTVIDERIDEDAKMYTGEDLTEETLKKVAASELISCINSKINVDEVPNSIKNIINEINNYYKQSKNYFAFKYVDIYTGFSVSFNENQKIFAASSIKAPTDIYLWEMASVGKVKLDDKNTYTNKYYNSGSGVLKSKKIGGIYTTKELLNFSTIYSDNAAHNMLMDRYGRTNMLKFWQDKGTNTIFTGNTNWGQTSAHDAAIYLNELYRFYVENSEYGGVAMNNFLNVKTKFLSGKNGYKVANKCGWSGSVMHDAAIIFADNPYIVVALSNLGQDYSGGYFKAVSDLADRLHSEYWKYKINSCNNIKQY